jgi:hypothetical protein
MTIIATVKIKEIFKTRAPFGNLKIRWAIRKKIMSIIGSRAGYC